MTVLKVTAAYKSSHYPQDGNISEEILVLEDGRAVYLTPTDSDEICESFSAAAELAQGELRKSESLQRAWGEGYEVCNSLDN